MKYKRFLIIILVLIVLIFVIYFIKNISKIKQFDDSNNFISSSNSKVEKNEYKFKIDYKNTKLKSVNLLNTNNEKTLVNEKIAPGTKGNFKIILNSNQDLIYKINFESINNKPKNLKFKASKDKVQISEGNTLEELSKNLIGQIYKNQEIEIVVDWYWDYESKQNEDIQDTEDSKNIREYKFKIYAKGEI